MSEDAIRIRGAREHNLKHIDLVLPRNQLIIITGLSGSGKSSLAFDTLYAEGQRRYVESLSAYARQFLERLEKPDVDAIDGLSPAIAIEQRTVGGNPRSTVATQTEIYDYLRVLFARAGQPHCPDCRIPISQQSAQEIVTQVRALPPKTSLMILAPLVRGRKGEYAELFRDIKRQGFVRVRVDGKLHDLDEPLVLDKKRAHTIEAVVDRLTLEDGVASRLTESIETALKIGKGLVAVNHQLFSELYACARCGFSVEEISPRMFSFNSPYGACPTCDGLGTRLEIDPELVVPDRAKSLRDGAIAPWRRGGMHMMMYYTRLLREVADHYRVDMDTPFRRIDRKIQRAMLYGADAEIWGGPFEGVIPNLERRFRATESDYVKEEIAKYMSVLPCPACHGARLKPDSLAVMIEGRSIQQVTALSVVDAQAWVRRARWSPQQRMIAEPIIKEISERLQFLLDVGLGYLTLDRASSTLSGGEAQRIRLATQVGSGLVGVLYILDEPSIGLHPRDNVKLLRTLNRLRDLGNTVIVVEHDEETIRHADYVVDLGPGAGKHGGHVVAAGTVPELLASPKSLTAQYLTGARAIPVPASRRPSAGRPRLVIKRAQEHNLKGIDVAIPLGLFVCVTGVSGSGKSTLIDDILYRALAKRLYGAKEKPGRHEAIIGAEAIDKIIVIDQSPIGRTPRSNPATYTGALSSIRDLFSQTPEARLRGFKPGRFSFNVKGGRCEACEGDGIKRIEMHFLPDVYVRCEVCKGRRFNDQTLQVAYQGRSIADVLAMTVEEAVGFFANVPSIVEKLRTVQHVGLDYIELGQPATTLSGGEAQRIKLSKELSKRSTGRTLYLLDEPTTGLHFADVEKLLGVLHRLVDQGNTVVVIEHNLEVVKTADYVIDLGPEGGEAGGRLVASGTPEDLAKVSASHTGQFLKRLLASFLLIAGLATSSTAAQAQEPSTTDSQGPYTSIQTAFLREDFANVARLVETLKPLEAHGPITPQTVRISLWYALSLERLQRTNEALRELDRLKTVLSALPEASVTSDLRRLWPEVLFWDGEISRRAFQTLRARRAYQRLLTEFPTSTWRAQAQLGLGFVLFHQQAYAAAREQVREAARGSPALPITRESLLLEGLCLVKLRAFEDAMTLFGAMLKEPLDPRLKAQAMLYLGEALAGLERFDEAMAIYQQVIGMDAESEWARFARFGMGWAYFQQHRCRESVDAFNSYVKSLPPSARRDADRPWAGSAEPSAPAGREGRDETSGDAYAELWLAQGRCLMELGNEGAALSHFEALRRYAPNHPLAIDAALSEAELLQRREQFIEAATLLSDLLRKPLTRAQALPIRLRLGQLSLAQGDAEGAITQFTQTAQADAPDLHQAALNGLGDAQLLRGEPHEARGWYERSVHVSPRSPEGLYATYQVGRLLVQGKELAGAIDRFRTVTVNADRMLANDARLALALAYLMSEEPTLARAELEQLGTQHATVLQTARAGYYLALLAVQDGEATRAMRLCDEAIRQAPRSDEAFEATLLLADLTASERSVQEALQVLRTSFGSMERLTVRRRGVVERKMAQWARQAGDYAQAIRWYEAAGSDLPAQLGELDYDAASCYEEAGDLVTAAQRYQVIRQDPWRIRGQLASAKLMERNHEWREARRLYEGVSRQAVPEAKIAEERLTALDQLEHDERSDTAGAVRSR